MAGFAINSNAGAGDRESLADLLEEAAGKADAMNLWYNGSPASSQYRETAEFLRQEEE
jgi:hypothetical protein